MTWEYLIKFDKNLGITDVQDGKWQVIGDFQELAGNEMGRRIYRRRWDVQDGKWEVMRWEDEFTAGDGTSKMGSGR